jgi:hypothetical protein
LVEGEIYKDVLARQGVSVSTTLGSSNFTQDLSTGRYSYNLNQNISYDTVSLIENSLIEWTQVESFWRSISTDTHYFLDVYADLYNGIQDTIWLTLGNGTQGKAPYSGSSYALHYIKCDGDSGNLSINNVTVIDDAYAPYVTVTNITRSSGGCSVESIEDYRLRIPLVVRTQRRAVSAEDYKALAISIPGIKRAQVVDRGDTDNEFPWEYVVIYLVPDGGGPLPSIVYDAVMAECRLKGALGNWHKRYILLDGIEYPVDVSINLGVEYGYSQQTVTSSVTSVVNAYFSVDNLDICDPLLIDDLHQDIMAVSGVSFIDFVDLDNIQPDIGNILTLGTFTVMIVE